jgi:hypothetical protein
VFQSFSFELRAPLRIGGERAFKSGLHNRVAELAPASGADIKPSIRPFMVLTPVAHACTFLSAFLRSRSRLAYISAATSKSVRQEAS